LTKIKLFHSLFFLLLFSFSSFLLAQEKEFLIPSISGEIKINGKGDELHGKNQNGHLTFGTGDQQTA
jgi:hypothetical protein